MRLRLRRLVLFKLLSFRKADDAKTEERYRLAAVHLLDVVLVNGLGAFDDPGWTPLVRGGRDGALTPYVPVPFDAIPRALLAAVMDERPKKPGEQQRKPRKVLYQPAAQLLGKLMEGLREQIAQSEGAAADAGGAARGAAAAALPPGTSVTALRALLTDLEAKLIRLLHSLQGGAVENLERLLLIVHEVTAFYPRLLLLEHAHLQGTSPLSSAGLRLGSCHGA